VSQLKSCLLIVLACLSGCSWFHARSPAPDPSELIVTGAPAGSTLFLDGTQAGQETESSKRPQVLYIAPGTHTLEVRMGDTVAYRENTYVAQSEKRVITVLSGANPN
jgi:hypothetical protein